MNDIVVANAISTDQATVLGDLFTKVINFIINLFFTVIDTLINLVTQPAVLSAIAFMIIVGIIYGFYKKRKIS